MIPVLRDTSQLSELLETLELEATLGSCEVVVVNGDEADDSIEQLRGRYPFVRWLSLIHISEPTRPY